MRILLAVVTVVAGCGRSSEPPVPITEPTVKPAAEIPARAEVVHEEVSAAGETRLFAGSVADLDGNGSLELVAGGWSAVANGRRSTVRVYSQQGEAWVPLTEAGWDSGDGSMIRNVELADLDGDGRPEVIALGKVGVISEKDAGARLIVLALRDGKLVELATANWRSGKYTHGYGLAVGDLDRDGTPEIVTGGFQFDGTRERGFVRVWTWSKGSVSLAAEAILDGDGAASMRVNDLAIGDVDGDRRADIVVAGRHGPLTDGMKLQLDQRRELGDLTVLGYADGKLATKARFAWAKGTSLRLRTVAVADLDGDHRAEIVTGGQYDGDGKPCLGRFVVEKGGKLVLRDDVSATEQRGEIKDLIIAGTGGDLRIITTGPTGPKPGRQGDVAAWRLAGGKLVRDASLVSRNGEETRARAVVVVPGAGGSTLLTIGHAQKNATTMVGQVLRWNLAAARKL